MDIGVPELLIVLFIVVLLFGPGRLVNIGRELGTGIREFREGLTSPVGNSKEEVEEEEAEQVAESKDEGVTEGVNEAEVQTHPGG